MVREAQVGSDLLFRVLIEHSPDAIVLITSDGTVTYASPSIAHLTGYTCQEVVGMESLSLLHPDDHEHLREHLTNLNGQAEKVRCLEHRWHCKDGTWRWIESTLTNLLDHPQVGALVCTARDITQHKQLPFEEFLGMVSHELRTPLTAIVGFLELALVCVERLAGTSFLGMGDLLGTLKNMLEQAQRQAEIETRLVEELLDMSRIQAQKFELSLQLCNLATIVQQVVANQQQVVPTRRIELVLPPQASIPVMADADRIEQVLTNYLTNAFKYSSPEQAVWVELSMEKLMARVSVRDQGPGLTEDQQQHIWDRYYQAETGRRQGSNGGLGLGLYIVRTIIAQHQGLVGVESSPGQGATFWFLLPLADGKRQD